MSDQYQKPLYDFGQAITRPWHLPGGRSFLFRLVIWGAALILLVYAVFGRKMIGAYGEFLTLSFQIEDQSDPAAVSEMMNAMWGMMGSAMFVGILAWLVAISIETAMHKNAFHGTDHGMLPLRFGQTELHVLLVQLVVFLVIGAVYLGGIFILFLLIGLGAAAGGGVAALMGLLALIGMFAWFVGLLLVAVRLAPAASMTVRDGTIRIFEAWSMTKPHFWPMLGSYLVVGVIGYIIIYIIMIVVVVAAFGNADFISVMSGLSEDEPERVFSALGEQMKSPRVFIPLVIGTVIYGFATLLWYIHLWGVGNYASWIDDQ